jgi:hypothetical protein
MSTTSAGNTGPCRKEQKDSLIAPCSFPNEMTQGGVAWIGAVDRVSFPEECCHLLSWSVKFGRRERNRRNPEANEGGCRRTSCRRSSTWWRTLCDTLLPTSVHENRRPALDKMSRCCLENTSSERDNFLKNSGDFWLTWTGGSGSKGIKL